MASATYQTVPVDDQPLPATDRPKRSRSLVATFMLAVCIISFVLQTELAQYVQKTTSYQKPYFILYVGHSCYIFMLPIQFFTECIVATPDKPFNLMYHVKETAASCRKHIQRSLAELRREQAVSEKYSDLHFIVVKSIWVAIALTVPAYLWYVSVNLTSMSNLTAIYNTSCFFAYLFSIFMLGDQLVASKIAAVALCMLGVFAMAYGDENDDTDDHSILGILVALLGAATYGFYEVYYKKYASPVRSTVLFANFVTGLIGVMTLLLLWIPIPLLHLTGYERFELPDLRTFVYILGVASMSLVYNASFMCVIALVNPVFAAVGVMLTVPAVAVVDVFVTGNMVPTSTITGSVLILIGFVILNHRVKKEESEQ
ncbi:uncharacterized protein BYT42DRAFT_573290 [Radiomyces spectabilis]|uniref:uncharacterized protein n=1 Tax=Radiomyces spectabilis TaxID=64574 RepID=UPI00221EB546|nr:uncharacterized protein BYT42DRAFT_573290 [Radiomyces spectabilis]KAI8376062.1 hypothetical protein BYT42DRAFT_573290 [Radiomyces spectabilis]